MWIIEHMAKDRKLFDKEFPVVHATLDQFAHLPGDDPMSEGVWALLMEHRKFLHHREGVEYIRKCYGDEAARSAEQHVVDDCGHVPNAVDYYTGAVDRFGQHA